MSFDFGDEHIEPCCKDLHKPCRKNKVMFELVLRDKVCATGTREEMQQLLHGGEQPGLVAVDHPGSFGVPARVEWVSIKEFTIKEVK